VLFYAEKAESMSPNEPTTLDFEMQLAPYMVPKATELWSRAQEVFVKHHALVALTYLICLELCIFGGSFARAGFFLDDWRTLAQFKFGPSDFWMGMHKYLVEDPRVLIRPLEAPYFALLYKLFGLKPAPYHFVNGAMEVISGFFLYMSVLRLTNSKATAFMCSVLFLVNPTHDATHYWMVCSSATLSLTLFMASFWAMLKAVADANNGLYVVSAALLALSLFNYESCLALPLVMVVGAGLTVVRKDSVGAAIRKCVSVSSFLLIPVGAAFIYQRYLSSMIAFSWVKRIDGNGSYVLPTILQGLDIQTPWALAGFIQKYLIADFLTGMNIGTLLLVAGCVGVSSVLLAVLLAVENRAGPVALAPGWQLAGTGFLFAVLALAVFGLNSEYMPLMITIVNRVNLGASVGASMITASLIFALCQIGRRFGAEKISMTLSCGLFTACVAVFSLSDRAFSHAWLASTVVQNRIREVMRSNAHLLQPGAGIVVSNCPRYVLWAPIADATWDLQPMLQIAANNDKIFATSISDRLQLSQTGIRDLVFGKEIANIKYENMYSLEPHTAAIKRIRNAQGFIDMTQSTTKQMGIHQSVVDRWRKDLQSQR
jgi:hypothetical protein